MRAWIIILYQFTCLKRTFSIIGTVCAGDAPEVTSPMVLKIVPLVFCSLTLSLPFHESGSPPFLLLSDYHFMLSYCLSCLFLSLFLSASRFVEHGMYRGHYYGTSLDSVQRVMAEGKVCILDMHPSVSIMSSKKDNYVRNCTCPTEFRQVSVEHNCQCSHGGKPVRDHMLLFFWVACAVEG